jgi:hypothetical protein
MEFIDLDALNKVKIDNNYSNKAAGLDEIKARLFREYNATLYHLALVDPLTNFDELEGNLGSDMKNNPSVADHLKVPKTAGGNSLSESEFFLHVRNAVEKARTGRWSYIDPSLFLDNPSLSALSWYESNRDPTNKNPTSTAYGLFQCLTSTYKDMGLNLSDVLVYSKSDVSAIENQCIAGIRYIADTYKTPERALAFQRATVKKDSTNLPQDLINKYKMWISRNYSGY